MPKLHRQHLNRAQFEQEFQSIWAALDALSQRENRLRQNVAGVPGSTFVPEIAPDEHPWFLKDPVAGDDYWMCAVPYACTIERVSFVAFGAGSQTVVFKAYVCDEYTAPGDGTGGTSLWVNGSPTAKTADSSGQQETSIDNPDMTAGQLLFVHVDSVTNNPTGLQIQARLKAA